VSAALFYDVKMGRCGLLVLILGLTLLDGCVSDIFAPPPAVTAVDMQSLQPDEADCLAVARERAEDALANGYDFNIEESVYREAYDDCMAWRRRNRSR
jgi:hypothetical protein